MLLSFSVRKEFIKNDNSFIVQSSRKRIPSDFIANSQSRTIILPSLDIHKLQTNETNDVYIFFARRDLRKLTCLTAKFQEEAIEPLREIAW